MTSIDEVGATLGAADAVLAKGCKEATRFVLTALNRSLRCSMLSDSIIVELVAGAGVGLTRGDPRRRVLAAALSTFLKSNLATVWNEVALTQREALYRQLCQSVALRLLPALLAEVATENKVVDLVTHLGTCIAMIVLIGPGDVTDVILDLSGGSTGVAVELSLAAMGILSDTRISLGTVRRSLSRLSLQKNLDRFLLTDDNNGYDGRRLLLALAEGMSFLSTSVVVDPQDMCPTLWEKMHLSFCWTFALEQLLTGSPCSSAVDAVCGVLSCATDATDEGVKCLIRGALATALQAAASCQEGLYVLARVAGGCLEGCIADIVTGDDRDLCNMIETALQTIGQHALESFQQHRVEGDMLLAAVATNTMLLLGSLKLCEIPEMDPDDDPDDFQLTIDDIQQSNALKINASERVAPFLAWTCELLRSKICTVTAAEVRDVVNQWASSDVNEWTTTAVEFDAPCVTIAVALERLQSCDWLMASITQQHQKPPTSLLELVLALSMFPMEQAAGMVQEWQCMSQQDVEAMPMLIGKAVTLWGEGGNQYVSEMIATLTARCCDVSRSDSRLLGAVLEATQRYTSVTVDCGRLLQMAAAHWPLREESLREIRGLVLTGRTTQPEILLSTLKANAADGVAKVMLSVLLGRQQPQALDVAEIVSLLTLAVRESPQLKRDVAQEGTTMSNITNDFAAALDCFELSAKVSALPLVAQFCGQHMDVPRFMLLLAPFCSVDGEYVFQCCQTSVNALIAQQPLPLTDIMVFVEAPSLVSGTVNGAQWYFSMLDWLLRHPEVSELFDKMRWAVLCQCTRGMRSMRSLIGINVPVSTEEVSAINTVLYSTQLAALTIHEGDDEIQEAFEMCGNTVGGYVYDLVAKGLLAPVLHLCSDTLRQVVALCCDDEFHLKQMLKKSLREG